MSSGNRMRLIVGGRQALSLRSFLLTVPIGVVAALVATPDPFASLLTLCQWLITGALAQAALGLVVFVGWRVTQHAVGVRMRVQVVLFATLAGALRGVVVAALPGLWDLPSTTTPATRILASSIIFAVWLLMIGAALDENARHREHVALLIDDLTARELRERARHGNAAPMASAMNRIAETTSAIGEALSPQASDADYAELAKTVRDAVELRVRPLSHALWSMPEPSLEHPGNARTFLLRVLRTPVPLPQAGPVMTLLITINAVVWHGWMRGLLVGLSASALSVLIIIGLSRPATAPQSARAHAVMYALLLALPTAVATLALQLLTQHSVPLPVVAVMATGVPVAFALSAATRTVLDDRHAMFEAMRAEINDDMWASHLNAAEERSANADAAAFLHSQLQARLTAAAIQLEQAAAQHDIERAESALAAAREAVQAVTNGPASQETPHQRLLAMARAWEGIARVELAVTAADVAGPNGSVIAEAVEEAVANAVRHGRASVVTVRADRIGDDMEIAVEDNGVSASGQGSPGLGLRRLASLTRDEWELAETGSGHRLRMRFTAVDFPSRP